MRENQKDSEILSIVSVSLNCKTNREETLRRHIGKGY